MSFEAFEYYNLFEDKDPADNSDLTLMGTISPFHHKIDETS